MAFAVSAALDTVVYHLLRERAYLLRVNGSNVVSAAADSLIFPVLAFGLPLLWPIVLGQFVAKVAGGALWAWGAGAAGGAMKPNASECVRLYWRCVLRGPAERRAYHMACVAFWIREWRQGR